MTDAYKKGTTPAGVAVVSAKRGFLPGWTALTRCIGAVSEAQQRREESLVSPLKKGILAI
jgi:hypothetical protein